MTALRRIVWLAALLVCGVAPAAARDLAADETTTLNGRVESFNVAMRDRKADMIIDVLPPRIFEVIGKTNNIEPGRIRTALVEQMAKTMTAGIIKAFNIRASAARYAALKDGTPYALLPTDMAVETNGRKIDATIDTLAMLDGGKWYLLDVSKAPQLALFTQAYPEFAGVSFGTRSLKAVP